VVGDAGGRIARSIDEHVEVLLWITVSGQRRRRLAKLRGACLHGIDSLQLLSTAGDERLILFWLRMQGQINFASWSVQNTSHPRGPLADVVGRSP